LRLVHETGDMANEIRLYITNLSRNSARVTHLFFRVESDLASHKQLDLDLPLAGSEKGFADVTKYVRGTVQNHVMGGAWQGVIEIRLGFVVAGTSEPRPSPWFPFKVAAQKGQVVEVISKMPYIAVDLRK